MALKTFTKFNYLFDEDEDEDLKPSQVAAKKQKKKTEFKTFIELGKRADAYVEPTKPPKSEPKKKEPTLLDKVGKGIADVTKKVTDFLTPKRKDISIPREEIAKLDITPEMQKQAESSYLKFPSLFPNPEREPNVSAQLTPEIREASLTSRGAFLEFWSNPVDNSILATRDFLTYHPQALETLAGAQKIVEETPLVGLKENPLTRGYVRSVSNTFLGSSVIVKDTFEKRLTRSVTVEGQVLETVGEVIGSVMAYVAGGQALKALQFGKLTLPVLFATLGQTSAPPETTLEQRFKKMPVDIVAGWLFSKIPVTTGINREVFKSLGKFSGIGSASAVADALIMGERDPKKIAQLAATQALMMALFFITGRGIGLFNSEILASKIRTGKGTFTPVEIRNIVNFSKYKGTGAGKFLLNIAGKAERAGKNVKLNMDAFKKSLVSKKLNLNKPEGIKNIEAELIEKAPELSVKPVVEPKTAAKPKPGVPAKAPKEIQPIAKKVTKYTSAKDFAEAEYSAKPTDQIGTMAASKITPRDPIDEAVVKDYENRIKAGEEIEPVEITKEKGKITTVDGSQKTTAYQNLGLDAPVVYRGKDTIEGLETFDEVYKKAEAELKEVEKEPVKEEVKPVEVVPEFHKTVKPLVDKYGLSDYNISEYNEFKVGLSTDKKTGYAIKSDGDLISVFNTGEKGNGAYAVIDGIENGATKLDHFEDKLGKLSKYYEQFGFEEYERLKWDDKYAPKNWDYAKRGRPDVVLRKLNLKKYDKFKKIWEQEQAKITLNVDTTRQGRPIFERNFRTVRPRPEGLGKGKISPPTKEVKPTKKPMIKSLEEHPELKKKLQEADKASKKIGVTITDVTPKGYGVEEPKRIEIQKVKEPKAKIFLTSAKKKLQQEVKDVVSSGKTQEEAVKKVDKYLTDTFNKSDDVLYERKLKAVRAELKRNMYEVAGATTGNWKGDYTYFQTARTNPDIINLVDRIEEGIFQIDEIVNPDAPSTMGFATTGSKPIGEFEKRVEPKKGTKEFKLFEKTKELTRKYAKIIGEGYTPRGALGVYYPETDNIFVNALNSLSSVSHEITHFLDKTYKISDKLLAIKGFTINGNPIYDPATLKYRRAITDLYVKYYDGGKADHKLRKRALEGFATLLQKYVEAPKSITEEYPLLVNTFLKEGGKYYHPVMKEIIKDLNEIVKEYQGLSSLDKVGSRVVTGDAKVDKSSFLNFRDRLRTFIADELYPTEVLAKKSGVHFTKADPSLWLRAYNNVAGIINNNINGKRGYWTFVKGDIKKTQDFNWKTLHKSLETKKNTDDFGYYLVARREHFTYKELDVLKEKFLQEVENLKSIPKNQRLTKDQDGKSPMDRAKEAKIKYQELKELLDRDGFVREEIDKAYFENKDRFIKEEKMFDTLTREDLKFLSSEEVQMISPKQYEELTSKQGYASFKRQFYNEVIGEGNEIPIQTRVGKTKVSSLLRRKGSEQAIINPLSSAISNHSEIMRKGLKQIVYNTVTDIGTSAAFPEIFQELDLKVSIDQKTGALFYPQDKDPNIIMGRLNYKRKPVLVDEKIKNVLDNVLTYRNIDTFVRLYTGLSRLFTAGTTGYYPPFAIINWLRDQITAQVNTVNKYKTLYSPIREFGKVLFKNSEEHEFYEEYMVMGGERQTFTGWQKLPPDKLAQRIRDEKSGLKKATLLLEKGTDVLSIPAKYSELVTRASEYIKARKAGKSTITALEEAGRLTAPFHHLGSWGGRYGQTFIRGIPYFNATLQVLDQHARIATTPDGRKRMLVVLMAITAAYIGSMMALLASSDEQKEQYKDLKPEELARYLYFPNPTGKKLIRLPMSEAFTSAGTVINMIIADKYLDTKYTQEDYIHAATAILPDQFDPTEPTRAFLSWIPQVFKSGSEVVMGVKTYPEVTPLESMSMKNLPPELRINRNTSAFAKWLGKKTGWSPIKVDYFITGYLGRGANIVLGKPDAWNFKGSVLRDYWFSNGRRVSGAYDKREENDQKYTAYQKGAIKLNKKEANELYRVKMLTNEFNKLMKEFRDADIKKNEKKAAELRTEIIIVMNKIETGAKPIGYWDWVVGARDRRYEKLEELGK